MEKNQDRKNKVERVGEVVPRVMEGIEASRKTTRIEELDDINVLRQKALVDIPAVVEKLEVRDDETAAEATRIVQGINTVIGRIEDFFKKSRTAAYAAWKEICANEETLKATPMQSRVKAQDKLNRFLTERRARLEEEERKRKDEEMKAQRERDRIALEEQQKQDKAIAAAAAAENAGRPEEAERIIKTVIETPIVPERVPLPAPRPSVQRIEGATERKLWSAEVVDFAKLPDAFKLANQRMLDSYATTYREKAQLSGVEFKWRISSAVGKMK